MRMVDSMFPRSFAPLKPTQLASWCLCTLMTQFIVLCHQRVHTTSKVYAARSMHLRQPEEFCPNGQLSIHLVQMPTIRYGVSWYCPQKVVKEPARALLVRPADEVFAVRTSLDDVLNLRQNYLRSWADPLFSTHHGQSVKLNKCYLWKRSWGLPLHAPLWPQNSERIKLCQEKLHYTHIPDNMWCQGLHC